MMGGSMEQLGELKKNMYIEIPNGMKDEENECLILKKKCLALFKRLGSFT